MAGVNLTIFQIHGCPDDWHRAPWPPTALLHSPEVVQEQNPVPRALFCDHTRSSLGERPVSFILQPTLYTLCPPPTPTPPKAASTGLTTKLQPKSLSNYWRPDPAGQAASSWALSPSSGSSQGGQQVRLQTTHWSPASGSACGSAEAGRRVMILKVPQCCQSGLYNSLFCKQQESGRAT